MANFYTDNDDIRFLFRYYQMTKLAEIMEDDFSAAKQFDWAPENATDAVDNYDRLLNMIGEISGDFIAPRAEANDRTGNDLNTDGSVTRPKGMQENLDRLAQAQVMGFTLPHRYGGLNCPNLIYNISTEIVSRADTALMNIYGLQGIAETINAYASEEIKQQYLPGFCDKGYTGAMVLTEPDAGSDLQAIKTIAYQDDKGQWRLHGVKRFITNGCGEVLLVLARSEPDRSGGLGLSLFVCDRGPTIRVRRLEDKLGIHGSPTCEMFFNHTPCQLIGERQRGLVTYVMSLMNGARVGIAAQSLGCAEAAYRVARDYAASRKQFGTAIENLPAVRDLLVEMRLELEAARTLTYETCWIVDHYYGAAKKLETQQIDDKELKKELKNTERHYRRLADMLTPMSKYLASEMSNSVTYDAMQVLGGSGYMRDYPIERHVRDARITTIYEGTSQLQVVAAVRGVCSGTADKYLSDLEQYNCPAEFADLMAILKQGHAELNEAIAFVKNQPGTEYMDLHGRKVVDIAIMLIVGHLFVRQATAQPQWLDSYTTAKPATETAAAEPDEFSKVRGHKGVIARRYIKGNAAKITMLAKQTMTGDVSSIKDYLAIVGPVPGK